MDYYAQTMPGIEQIAWLELKSRFRKRVKFQEYNYAKEQNGILLFSYAGSPNDLLKLRSVEDIFCFAFSLDKISRDWRDLRLLSRTIQESETLQQALATLAEQKGLPRRATWRVIARKHGKHEYRRKDVADAIIKGMQHRYGRKYKRVDDDADIEIWINVLGSKVLCGIRLSDASMRHRDYKTVHLPASLRPSVAAAMVVLTEPMAEDIFVDPMCGGGTIVVERILAGPYREVAGGDIDRETVHIARQTLRNVKGHRIRIEQWDAGNLPRDTQSISHIVTNLPFGKQIGSPKKIAHLYPRFFSEAARVLQPTGTAIVLSSEYELIKDVVRQQEGLEIITGYSVAVLGQWGRIYIIRKQ